MTMKGSVMRRYTTRSSPELCKVDDREDQVAFKLEEIGESIEYEFTLR